MKNEFCNDGGNGSSNLGYNIDANDTTSIQSINNSKENSKLNHQVCSYGLICFYKKPIDLGDYGLSNE